MPSGAGIGLAYRAWRVIRISTSVGMSLRDVLKATASRDGAATSPRVPPERNGSRIRQIANFPGE